MMERHEQFESLIDGWFWETDAQHRFVYLSENVEKYTGIKPEWHYGKSRMDMRGDGIPDADWTAHIETLNAHSPFYNFRYRRIGPDATRWLATSGEPFYDASGVFLGYRGAARNITDEIILAGEADQAKAQLLAALDIIEEGFVYYDADDRLVLCNDTYRRYYPKSKKFMKPGAQFENIIRQGAIQGEYENAIGRIEEWVAERMQAHYASNITIEQELTDGRWLRISERRMPDGGIVGMRVDITDLKEAQMAAETARIAAESANLAKSNFLSTMSHEIRTPLNGVLGLAQLLKDTNLNQDQQNKVGTILSSGQTLLAIINDVLDMSRIEAGGMELEEKVFSMNNLVSMIATPFQSLADDKGLILAVSDTIDANIIVKGDPVRLRQVLWNLLSNAIKFTDKGSVTLTIGSADNPDDPTLKTKDHLIQFSVKDTGAGIAPDRVDAIFDAFTQEDSTITRKFGGTGLGLSIVKQLTELMGGTIYAKSDLGKGTVFDVFLPFDAASKIESDTLSLQGIHDAIQAIEPLNILIAEDNEVNALIARAFLEKAGHKVIHVKNGKHAVVAAKEDWADLVFMDIHMPEMNGIDATRMIRTTDTGKTLPIVGLTAEAFTERHTEFITAGMDGVLTKPFTEQQLSDTLTTYRWCRGSPPDDTNSLSINPLKEGGPKNTGNENTDMPNDALVSLPEGSPIGDIDKLDVFREQMTPAIVASLMNTAQISLLGRMEELRQGVGAADPIQIREAAHSIKGACGSMFAARISELAGEIENNSTDIDAIQNLMPNFESVASDTIDWWRKQSE